MGSLSLLIFHDNMLISKGAKGWQPLISSIALPDNESRLTAQAQSCNSHSIASFVKGGLSM